MPRVEIIPDKRKVVGLVEQAYEGKICLPNFQRDFVWTREAVADLVRSIVRGYFIGSLLLLQCDPANPPFAPIFLRGASPPHREPRPELLILDGQQRLSSLLYALTAPDLSLKDSSQRRWFFINLDALLADPDSDEIVFDRARRELRGLDSPQTQFEQRMLPCTELLSQERFYQWRDGFEDWLQHNAPEKIDQYRSEWRNGWTSAATAFQTFNVALIELPRVQDADSEALGRVCAIFEKLNSTGVDLSVYDLLTARLYRSGIHALSPQPDSRPDEIPEHGGAEPPREPVHRVTRLATGSLAGFRERLLSPLLQRGRGSRGSACASRRHRCTHTGFASSPADDAIPGSQCGW
jgi:hypothetical protein